MTDWFIGTDPMNKIIEGLYLGNYLASSDKKLLKKHGITHILRVVREDIGEVFPKDFTYKFMELRDIPEQDIKTHFEEAHKFIDNALRCSKDLKSHNKVLVHCHAGVSRSSTMVISYLMKRYINFSFEEAFRFVKSKRSIIQPNSGFIKQLKEFEKQLKSKVSSPSSVSSCSSQFSRESSTRDSIDYLNTKIDQYKMSKVASMPSLHRVKHAHPIKRASGPLPVNTPFINMEGQKLASTINEQNLYSPGSAPSKSYARTPSVLSKSGLDIVSKARITPRSSHSGPVKVHPSVYNSHNYKKSQFSKEKNFYRSAGNEIQYQKNFITPQTIPINRAEIDSFGNKSAGRYIPTHSNAPSWNISELQRVSRRPSLFRSMTMKEIPQLNKKRVTFDL
ncbi:unnamed protein product [Moneuplotes crassus]|uniref:protein-tyrosine-phosphatase n=1 Tax=Euplotes crassus TaxID=5936 RepID=A0AAD1UDL6_EUPCR|nr:unnamed protein product [Moneuplotes crassus]